MPRGKTEAYSAKKEEKSGLLGQIKLGESYTSLLLGIVVVIIASILLIGVVKNRNAGNKSAQEISSDKTEKSADNKSVSEYTVAKGDTLWSISEKVYKSGYNWVDIAKANKIENPDLIETGVKLALPKIETIVVAADVVNNTSNINDSNNAITQATYAVQKGDDLWDIAIRAYGDGYAWVKIAKANNLENPDIIHSGNQLKIPR